MNPILIDPHPDKQYYPFTDCSKHSLSDILVQYVEQTIDDRTENQIPHPITYQSRTFQGSQKK